MRELSKIEEDVAAAIDIFNSATENFNNAIQEFPGNVVNEFLNHEIPLSPFKDSAAESELEYTPGF